MKPPADNINDAKLDRYVRQTQFAPLGVEGQQRLQAARVLIVGCGALGSVLANTLARAGVGRLRIVDRDFLELNNLQRQVLYDEADVRSHLPKAIAAANRLRSINSEIEIEPLVCDVDHTNIRELADGVDIIADGTDNFSTRFLINDAAYALGIPWVYGGCIGAEGQSMTVVPGQTACLRCLMPEMPPPGSTPTCDTAGILGPIVNIVASWQAAEVLKLASGNADAISRGLTVINLWDNRIRHVKLDRLAANDGCIVCSDGEYRWLSGEESPSAAVLCGRNAVQLSAADRVDVDLPQLSAKLDSLGRVTHNKFLLRAEIDAYIITVFADGRTIVGGTDDPAQAKSIVARYVGS